jgi:RNA polymerase sigma-70 factor (ECF subfamily)
MQSHDDVDLIRRFKEGDRGAFQTLVIRYLDRVAGVAARSLGDRHEALDVAQEVFLEAHRALAAWREEGQLFSWLYRTTLHLCSHRLRRRRFVPLEQAPPKEAPRPPEAGRLDAIRRAVDALPERQRDVFLLRHELDLPLKEIGERLGLAEGTVKIHLHRALAALRDSLGKSGFR